MKIGIPKALIYHRYDHIWETFFRELKHEAVFSRNTDFSIIREGYNYTDENLLAEEKIFIGHFASLIGFCDLILCPKDDSQDKDISNSNISLNRVIRTLFPHVRLLEYDLDILKTKSDCGIFVALGAQLNKSPSISTLAYHLGKRIEYQLLKEGIENQNNALTANRTKILLAGSDSILKDAYLMAPVLEIFSRFKITPVFSNLCEKKECLEHSGEISKEIKSPFLKEIIGSAVILKSKVEGIIFLSIGSKTKEALIYDDIIKKVEKPAAVHISMDEEEGFEKLKDTIGSFILKVEERRLVQI